MGQCMHLYAQPPCSHLPLANSSSEADPPPTLLHVSHQALHANSVVCAMFAVLQYQAAGGAGMDLGEELEDDDGE